MLRGQQIAAMSFLNAWFYESREREACLKGYAGTGKTFLIGQWIESVQARNPNLRITVMAPTNKALDVLREKCEHVNVGFATIDSFLGNRIKKNDDGETEKSRGKGQENPDLIICDEASMIKADYHTDLRRRGVRTLYVGDPVQLPPINEELSTTFQVSQTFEMTEVIRYDGAIIKAATFMRECALTKRVFTLLDVMGFRDEARTLSIIKLDALYSWALSAYKKGMDARIIAFTNADVARHNAWMHASLFPDAPLFGVGERVLVNETFELPTQNPDSKESDMLYNGEILTVTSCERNPDLDCGVVTYAVGIRRKSTPLEVDGVAVEPDHTDYVLNVPLDESHALSVHKDLTNRIWTMRRSGMQESEVRKLLELRKPLNKLAPLRHSYANTVHKSQGSTYDIAFCDWSSIYRSSDRARMMYTSMTRPSKFLVLACK
jgi:hypothetical protein